MTGGSSPEDGELRAARTPGNPGVCRTEASKGREPAEGGSVWGYRGGQRPSAAHWVGGAQSNDVSVTSETCLTPARTQCVCPWVLSLSPSLGGTVPRAVSPQHVPRPCTGRGGLQAVRGGGLRLEEAGPPAAAAASDLCH